MHQSVDITPPPMVHVRLVGGVDAEGIATCRCDADGYCEILLAPIRADLLVRWHWTRLVWQRPLPWPAHHSFSQYPPTLKSR